MHFAFRRSSRMHTIAWCVSAVERQKEREREFTYNGVLCARWMKKYWECVVNSGFTASRSKITKSNRNKSKIWNVILDDRLFFTLSISVYCDRMKENERPSCFQSLSTTSNVGLLSARFRFQRRPCNVHESIQLWNNTENASLEAELSKARRHCFSLILPLFRCKRVNVIEGKSGGKLKQSHKTKQNICGHCYRGHWLQCPKWLLFFNQRWYATWVAWKHTHTHTRTEIL